MITDDREVAGLRCSEVLALLSEFVDGELDPSAEQGVREHVAGCGVCERFGGAFATVIARLREGIGPAWLPADVATRLRERLDRDAR